MKKWLCYFINSQGHRDGTEYIHAYDRIEADEIYRRFFNISNYDDVRVIPVLGGNDDGR